MKRRTNQPVMVTHTAIITVARRSAAKRQDSLRYRFAPDPRAPARSGLCSDVGVRRALTSWRPIPPLHPKKEASGSRETPAPVYWSGSSHGVLQPGELAGSLSSLSPADRSNSTNHGLL